MAESDTDPDTDSNPGIRNPEYYLHYNDHRVRCGFRVRRGSGRKAVRQAQVRISAQHSRGGPLLSGSYEDNKMVFDE
jgi:hypothetical protein